MFAHLSQTPRLSSVEEGSMGKREEKEMVSDVNSKMYFKKFELLRFSANQKYAVVESKKWYRFNSEVQF